MADEGKKPETTETTQTPPEGGGYKEVVENGHTYLVNEATGAKFFAGDYVEQVRAEAKTNREKLAELEAAKDAERQKQLEEQGKFKELATETAEKLKATEAELAEAKKRLAAIDEATENARKALLAKLPQDKQEKYATASAEIIQDVLDVLNAGGAPNPDPGKPNLTNPKDPSQKTLGARLFGGK